MDIMDIQAVESKLSDVTVTPIPRSQVQNFYNYQQQREQREQQPQIQISAIHHTPRERNVNNEREYGHHGNNNGGGRDSYAKRERDYQQMSNPPSTSSAAAAASSPAATLAALQYTQQLQAQLALLQQQANTIASPLTPRSSCSQGSGNGGNSSHSQLKYPQSTSPLSVTQISANITTPLTSTANLPTVSTSAASNGLSKYAQLLAVIEEMGRDIRPTYTGSRSSTERLKRGIVHARILVRECLLETERSARQ